MSKHRVVIFLPHTAREETSDDPTSLLHYQNAVLDPDLSKVKGLYPPHFWKLDGAEVVPMTEEEMQARILFLDDAMKKGITFSNVPEKKPISEVINSLGEFHKKAAVLREEEEKRRLDNVSSIKRAKMMRDGMRKAAEDALKAEMKFYTDTVVSKTMANMLEYARKTSSGLIEKNNRKMAKAVGVSSVVVAVVISVLLFLV